MVLALRGRDPTERPIRVSTGQAAALVVLEVFRESVGGFKRSADTGLRIDLVLGDW